MKKLKILKNFINNFIRKKYKISYSQCGEDLMINYILKIFRINKPFYLDIGAFDPFDKNNLAIFYKKGGNGINIEPNPLLYKKFLKKRRRDINLNIGIGKNDDLIDFYIMSSPTMSTFSEKVAQNLVNSHGFKIINTIKINTYNINNIIKKYAPNKSLDILSIDIEGLDDDVVKSIDFTQTRPLIICAETADYSKNGNGKKNHSMIEYLKEKNYITYADTYLNTIFIDNYKWQKLNEKIK